MTDENNKLVIMNRQELAAFSAGGGGLQPTNLQEAMQLANLLADSEMVPKDYRGKPGNVLVAIQFGAEIGLKPMQAMQNIASINGRPAVWGDAALAICMQHPQWGDIDERCDGNKAVCVITKKNGKKIEREYSVEDAKTAKLWGKEGPWTTNPKRQLQMRARGFALRDTFPDALKGLALREEAADIIDVAGHSVDVTTGEVDMKREPTPAEQIASLVSVDLLACSTREHLVTWARCLTEIKTKAGAKAEAWKAWQAKCEAAGLVPAELAEEARKG